MRYLLKIEIINAVRTYISELSYAAPPPTPYAHLSEDSRVQSNKCYSYSHINSSGIVIYINSINGKAFAEKIRTYMW